MDLVEKDKCEGRSARRSTMTGRGGFKEKTTSNRKGGE